MSQAEQETVTPNLDEAEIAAYLEQNPSFLDRHPQALEALEAHHQSGSAESLIERQVKTLRETNRGLQQRFGQLVDNARGNEQRVVQLNDLAQVLVSLETIEAFVPELTQVVHNELGVDAVFVGLDSDSPLPDDIYRLPTDSAASEALTNMFRRGEPILGTLDDAQIDALFGPSDDNDSRPSSAAMIPLGKRATSGALVLASNDPERFGPEMGALFLELTGQLVTTALRRLLGDSALA